MTDPLLTPRAWLRRARRLLPGAPPGPLPGRTVLVTGASSGIGEAVAYAVARRGAHVLLVARRADELARVADAVSAAGGSAEAYPCDMSDPQAIDALVTRVLADHGAVDYLVNNAGRSIRRSLALSEGRFHDFERLMTVNFLGPARLTMGLLPAMRAQRFGHVVNILTWGNQVLAPKFAAYIASKSALDVFGRILGREAWYDNVTCTNVRLGFVRTPMIGPSADVYPGVPALTPERAAARVVRALEDRPVNQNTLVGPLAQVANLAAPRLSDWVSAAVAHRSPDSAAARGDAAPGESRAG